MNIFHNYLEDNIVLLAEKDDEQAKKIYEGKKVGS